MPGPLAGVRIVDMTTVILGPYATQILGDLGADVIKIESPEGDQNRNMTPGRHFGMGGASLNLNRNKRSLAIDVKRPSGREAVLRLAAGADVFIHNIRPQAMRRLNLTYEDVRAVRPDIVYCSTIGFRSDGPYGEKPAYDDMIQGGSGLAAIMGRFYGKPGYVPATACDKIVALTAVYAVTSALFHRERTGEGQAVEVPMFETMVAFNLVEHFADAVFDPPAGPFGYPRVLNEYRRPYATADGYVSILPYTDRQWRNFCTLAGRPELAEDARFRDFVGRAKNVGALYACVDELARGKTTAEWVRLCDEHNIPAMAVTDIADLPDDPHLATTGFFEFREHPSEGRYRTTGAAVRFAASPAGVRRDAPRLGENGVEILREAGYSAEEIEALVADGTIPAPAATVPPHGDRET